MDEGFLENFKNICEKYEGYEMDVIKNENDLREGKIAFICYISQSPRLDGYPIELMQNLTPYTNGNVVLVVFYKIENYSKTKTYFSEPDIKNLKIKSGIRLNTDEAQYYVIRILFSNELKLHNNECRPNDMNLEFIEKIISTV